jgi:hypothetical protein
MTDTVKPAAPLADDRFGWLTPDALGRVRAVLLGVTVFVGLAVYVFHSLGPIAARPGNFVSRLQGVGVLTWLYALAQMGDMRFYNSRFAQRRRQAVGLPDSLHGLLFGQMVAWYGILYYGLTGDFRPFIAGLAILALAFWVFPIRRTSQGRPDSLF